MGSILIAYLVVLAAEYWLKYLNLSNLKSHSGSVPPEFEGAIDPAQLSKISKYTVDNNRVALAESLAGNVLLILFLFGGLLAGYDSWIHSFEFSFIVSGLLFAFFLAIAQKLIDVPFSLYRNFVIESRHGFNTMTLKLWLSDQIKSVLLSLILGGLVLAAALWIINANPGWWWLWVWIFLLLFGIFMMYLSPVLIEPLFFKFEPVRADGFEDRIREMMARAGLKISRVFQVDASRRSRHSNAYFTGIGRVKRIVLFDTLIRQMSQEEILAVLAHEAGHWKKRHVLKRILAAELSALFGLFIAYHLIQWAGLPGLIGEEQASFYARIVIVGFLSSVATFPLTPLFSAFSRRHERESDRFAAELAGDPESLASALIKLSRENLSNLHPHPLYACFYYSHPPVVERIRSLRKTENKARTTETIQ